MNPPQRIELPGYAKFALILLGGVLVFYVLSRAGQILVPISFAFLISLLLQPVYRKLLKWKFPKAVAAILCIFMILMFLAVIIFFMSAQIARIAQDLPEIGRRFNEMVDQVKVFLESRFGINQEQQSQYIKDSINTLSRQGSVIFANAITTTTRVVTFILLLVIPLFFFLYYKEFFRTFLLGVTKDADHIRLEGLINEVEHVVQSYISGLFMVIVIIAVMNTIGLSIIGVDYALFFGVTAALLNIIPFIGVFIGSLLPIVYALVTMDSLWAPVAVAILFWLVQFLEGNIITPNIVGGKVSINPFAAIIALFVGGAVWGAAGMILFIPFTGILKVLFDNVDKLKPFGFLLGDPGGKGKAGDRISKWWEKVKEKFSG